MAKSIMVMGTASNVGKSLLAAALCRIFRQDGYRVAPFKAQNMALNSFITRNGFEIGRAQAMQAEAAGCIPDVRMNPILLKPTGDMESQVVLNGVAWKTMPAMEYYDRKLELLPYVYHAYQSLAQGNDIIVLEGAGSPAEINLKREDFVNTGLAKMTKSPALLVGDIDRGGIFASFAGTLQLLEPEERRLFKGLVVNKFRGDLSLLQPGLEAIGGITGVPVVGTVPYLNLNLDAEDSLSEPLEQKGGSGVLDLAVIHLPRISNFTDFQPFTGIPGVSLRYVSSVHEFGNPDLLFLPGSKNTMADLAWLRESGLEQVLLQYVEKGNPLFGICGGYQMMGQFLRDPEQVEAGGSARGLGLLPHSTVFSKVKQCTQAGGKFREVKGIFSTLSGVEVHGYEVHMGCSESGEPLLDLVSEYGTPYTDGGWSQNCCGTYLHGLFDRADVRRALLQSLLDRKGKTLPLDGLEDWSQEKERAFDHLADTVRQSLDMEQVYSILEQGV